MTVVSPFGSGDDAASRPWRQQALASAAREVSLSRVLTAYVIAGMLFMLLPGTLLGVWNLLSISNRHSPDSLAPGWIQAHGHAQVFGWIGTFIIGIGYYSIPKVRRLTRFAVSESWICLVLWTAGVAIRWTVGAYEWKWRVLLPLSALLELTGFLIFFNSVATHRPATKRHQQPEEQIASTKPIAAANRPATAQPYAWMVVVIAGTAGLLLALILNSVECSYLALKGDSPAFGREFDLRFLTLSTWGFLVPFVWGFASRWMPAFLGLKPSSAHMLLAALGLNTAGVVSALLGQPQTSALFLLCGTVTSIVALRLFDGTRHPAKTRTVSAAFPAFVRIAFIWSFIAAVLGMWASLASQSAGIGGASRHALTVGFIATMVFSVGPRVLPAFTGLHELYSARLMSVSLALVTLGCGIRVSSEIIAYQGYADWGWSLLPLSAIIEMMAVAIFALNMAATLLGTPLAPASAAGDQAYH
jgi:hypothetical protein